MVLHARVFAASNDARDAWTRLEDSDGRLFDTALRALSFFLPRVDPATIAHYRCQLPLRVNNGDVILVCASVLSVRTRACARR